MQAKLNILYADSAELQNMEIFVDNDTYLSYYYN